MPLTTRVEVAALLTLWHLPVVVFVYRFAVAPAEAEPAASVAGRRVIRQEDELRLYRAARPSAPRQGIADAPWAPEQPPRP